MSESTNSSFNETNRLSQKDIEFGYFTRQKQLAEEELKKKVKFRVYLIAGIIFGALGAVLSYFSTSSDEYRFEYVFEIQLRDSLSSHNIDRVYDIQNDNFTYRIDSNFRQSTSNPGKIQDSLIRVEKAIKTKILKKAAPHIKQKRYIWTSIGFVIGVVIGIGYVLLIIVVVNYLYRTRLRKISKELLNLGFRELHQDNDKHFFTRLVEINFKYLDQYYMQTQQQADKSFIMCAFAAVIGFTVIIVGIVMMFSGPTKVEPAYVTTGAGVVSEFIAAVFFYLYNKTVVKMSQYHQKLVITQNISLALKTAETLKDSKEKVLETIVDRLTADVNKHLTQMPEL